MASDQEFCLRWNNHQSTLVSVFDRLLSSEVMTDVTLAAEGRSIKAHRLVLSACSPFFQDVLNTNPDKHMVIFLKDVPFDELRALVNYMYKGEVSVAQDKLTSLIRIAENLKVRGLAEPDEAPSKKLPPLPKLTPAVIKREPTPQRASTPPSTKKRKKTTADPPPSLQPAVISPAEEVEEPISKIEGQSLLEKSLLMPREINANHVDYTPAAGPSFHLKKEEINMESADEAEEGEDWSGPEGEEPSGSWPEQNDSIGENAGENSTQDVLLQVSPPRKRYLKTEGYKCEVCNKIYKYPNNLTRHRRTECGVEPSMKCFYCPKMFSRKDKLRDHLNKCHTKEIMEALMHYSNPTEGDEVGNNNNI